MHQVRANHAPVHQTGRHDIVKKWIVLNRRPKSFLQTDNKKARQQTTSSEQQTALLSTWPAQGGAALPLLPPARCLIFVCKRNAFAGRSSKNAVEVARPQQRQPGVLAWVLRLLCYGMQSHVRRTGFAA
jgi:hypothetical protein